MKITLAIWAIVFLASAGALARQGESLPLIGTALAQQPAATVPNQAAASDTTRIEADNEANVIRFFIDGREAMRLDKTGLHVREEINYGATITDYGRIGFDAHSEEGGDAR